MNKVACTRALQETAGLDLASAKAITDSILAGVPQSIMLATSTAAESLAADLDRLGVVVNRVESA